MERGGTGRTMRKSLRPAQGVLHNAVPTLRLHTLLCRVVGTGMEGVHNPALKSRKTVLEYYLINQICAYRTSMQHAVWRFSVHEDIFGSSTGDEGITSMVHSRVHLDHSAYSPRHIRDGGGVPRVRQPRGD
jgi:hypothetical protein